jgi:hypothetical protein
MTEIRLAYGSRARVPEGSPEIRAIERSSLRNNSRLGVTGALYYDGESFFQVLEGPENAVALLFDDIRADPRHGDVTLVCHHPITERMFGLWSMKMVNAVDHPELAATFRAAAAAATPSGLAIDPRIEALRVV